VLQENIILDVDSYKASHYLQYPAGTNYISCYVESRGGEYKDLLFFGLQAFLIERLTKPITRENIDDAKAILTAHGLPFNEKGWEYILNKHNGYLPIAIEAVKEGTVLPTSNVLVQIVNTDPECFWLPGYIETALLRGVWYPTTVATVSLQCKKIISKFLKQTSDNKADIYFRLHDFGARAATSKESSSLGGMSHLVNFKGTDTVLGLLAAKKYYDFDMTGYSIPAAEHSTIISWGKEKEKDAYVNIIDQFDKENGTFAIVADSYDLWNAIDNIFGEEIKGKIEKLRGRVVIRPDSGDPLVTVVSSIEKLIQHFGCSVNGKGYKVLPKNIRVIQGDGVCINSIEKILLSMKDHKLSTENIYFGMGGNLLQKLSRETLRFVMKASAININGEWVEIYKAPSTDLAKTSKKGIFALIKEDGHYKTILKNELGERENLLVPVFKNGQLITKYSFDEIRKRSEETL